MGVVHLSQLSSWDSLQHKFIWCKPLKPSPTYHRGHVTQVGSLFLTPTSKPSPPFNFPPRYLCLSSYHLLNIHPYSSFSQLPPCEGDSSPSLPQAQGWLGLFNQTSLQASPLCCIARLRHHSLDAESKYISRSLHELCYSSQSYVSLCRSNS